MTIYTQNPTGGRSVKIFQTEDKLCSMKEHWYHDSDSEAKFKQNLKKTPSDWKYRTETITYQNNSLGYRTKELNKINWKKSIVVLGCSLVYGVGVSEKDTISSQLSEITGHYVVNMGVSGSSGQFAVHNLACLLEYYKPKAIAIGWPDASRVPLYLKDRTVHCGSWRDDPAGLGIAMRRYDWHGHSVLQLQQLIARRLGMTADFTLFKSVEKILDVPYCPIIDYARDLSHGGVKTYRNVANCIAEQLSL
tara:strand:- start:1113 stop:1859 length:747 start_codon:yes stop_codon:yes gene_type:complete